MRTEFAGYNAKRLTQDLMAGLTVAAVALPLALAFGVSSGATAASGILTAIICGFTISLFGGAFCQISGQSVYNDNGTKVDVVPGLVTFTASGQGHGVKNTGDEVLVFIALIVKE